VDQVEQTLYLSSVWFLEDSSATKINFSPISALFQGPQSGMLLQGHLKKFLGEN